MSRLCSPRRLLAGCLLLTAAAAGCTDPVRVYDAPPDKQRLLGAIVLVDDGAWFVKLMGKADEVAGAAGPFWQFVHSLKFPNDGPEPIAWTAPEDWKHEKGQGLRYATFRLPEGLEVGVFHFGRENSVLDNVNRWRGQLKLKEIGEVELEREAKKEKIDGHEAYLLDLESARTDAIPADPGSGPAAPATTRPIDFTPPEGWSPMPPSQMREAGFELEDHGQKATLTVSGAGGGIIANVNRWRGQVGLPSASAEEIEKSSQSIDVAGVKALTVDLTGPERDGAKPRILAAIFPGEGGRSWFVKMNGPDELLAKHRAEFDSFVRSVRLGGGQ
ncbi:MAG: hypothetical protein ACJ8F7_11740 [Gemmataceae bacterium]